MTVVQVVVLIFLPLVLAEPNSSDWQFIGCFQTVHSSDLREYLISGDFNISSCRSTCQSNNGQWYGWENGSNCYCGMSDYPSVDSIVPHADCMGQCPEPEKCGGQNVSALYTGKTYKGCYENPPEISVAFQRNVSNLTLDYCRQRCSQFTFYGVTHGNKCVCTNMQPERERVNGSHCFQNGIPCAGSKPCGVFKTMSIWSSVATLNTFEDVEQEIKNFLHQDNITNEQVVRAAEVIEKTTNNSMNFVNDNPKRLNIIAEGLEALANQKNPSVTRPVVNAVNNLMTLDETIIHQSFSDTGKVLWALNQQISNVQEMHTGNYTQITKNIGIKAVKVNTTRVGKSICFGTFALNTETSSGNADLHENNTKMIDVDDDLETAKTTISVPKAALDLYSRDLNRTVVAVSFIIYDNSKLFVPSKPMEDINDTNTTTPASREFIATQIISVKIEGSEPSDKPLPDRSHVTASFSITKIRITNWERLVTMDCVHWNSNKRTWSKSACDASRNTPDRMECACNRLGSFAILIRLGKDDVIPSQDFLYWITFIGSILSCVCLFMCMLTMLFLKSLREKTAVYIHLNLCISLLCFYISFLLSMKVTTSSTTCSVLSSIVQYFGLVLVTWMTIEAINIYIIFTRKVKFKLRSFLLISCSFGYGVPIIPTVLVAVFDNVPVDVVIQYCFIHPGPGLYYGFVLEVGALCIFNIFVYIWITNRVVCRPLLVSQVQKHAKRDEILARVRHGVLFWFVLGIPWTFGFLAAIDRYTSLFDYLFCILLSLQGVALFLLLAVANPELKKALVASVSRPGAKSQTRSTNTSEGTPIYSQVVKQKKMKPTELLLLTIPPNKWTKKTKQNRK